MTVITVPDQTFADRIGELPDGVSVVVWDPEAQDLPATVRDEVAMVLWPDIVTTDALERLLRLPHLRLVQLQSAGYEHMLGAIRDGVSLANGRGVHSDETAEWAVMLTVAIMRGLPAYLDQQRAHSWRVLSRRTFLAGSRVMVIGAGSIGAEIAARLAPHKVEITAVGRTSRTAPDGRRVLSLDEARGVLPEMDAVVVIVPATPETRHLVDADFLAAMKDDSYLVNVARGAVVDAEALARECAAGRITAALDVTDPEPLPADSPLWDTPNLVITPHVAGEQSRYSEERVLEILREQIAAYLAGAPQLNVVAGPVSHGSPQPTS